MSSHSLLEKIGDPADLRRLDRRSLGQLATELRAFIVDSVAATGGHLSSNLGTVELTIALHYVFRTPEDRLIWDVGHQTYGHKILTGRREGMRKLRQKGGISGFPRREESRYDTFGTAHSSTSISAALEAGEALNATVANMRFVKPVDRELAYRLAGTHDVIVTVEENVVAGGAGSAVAEALAADGVTVPLLMLGLPDQFVEHGDSQQLLAECGLDGAGIARAIREHLDESGRRPGKAA